jgi:type II secretory pathway pseudopilin PulG
MITARRAFSLVEVLVVMFLLVLLTGLIAGAWSGLGRPVADVAAQSRLSIEANLAAASFARDLGGSLTDEPTGSDTALQFVGRMQLNGPTLWLCFDGDSDETADWAIPDRVVTYSVQDGNLVRWNQYSGSTFVVARHLDEMQLADLGSGRLQIMLTFKYRSVERTYTLIARDP